MKRSIFSGSQVFRKLEAIHNIIFSRKSPIVY